MTQNFNTVAVLEDISSCLDALMYSLDRVDQLNNQQVVLLNADNSEAVRRNAALHSARVRQNICQLYDMEYIQVSAYDSVPTLLEAEASAGKSVIRRMIDWIVESFSKLWKAITSIFSSSEKPSDADKGNDKMMTDFNELSVRVSEITIDTSELDKIFEELDVDLIFGFAGNDIDIATATKALKDQLRIADVMAKLLANIEGSLDDIKVVAEVFTKETTAEQVNEKMTEFNSRFADRVKSLMDGVVSPEDIKNYDMAEKGNYELPASYAVRGIMSKKGEIGLFFMKEADTDNKPGPYKGKVGRHGNISKSRKSNFPNKTSDWKPLIDQIAENRKAAAKVHQDTAKAADSVSNKFTSIKNSLNALSELAGSDKGAGFNTLVKHFINLIAGVKSCAVATASGLKYALDAHDAVNKFQEDFFKRVENESKRAKKAEEEKGKDKENGKPEDGTGAQ